MKINEKTYGDLLFNFKSRLIADPEEHQRALSEVEKLMTIANLTPEQDQFLDLLVGLIEKFEEEKYPIDLASPHEILLHLMEENNLRQVDLIGILGSRGVVSEVVTGKRQISKNQAKALAKFFNTDVGVFI